VGSAPPVAEASGGTPWREPVGHLRRPVSMLVNRRPSRLVFAAGLVVAALTGAACSSGASTPSPTATGPLVTVETRGGLCAPGPCGTTVILDRDGRVRLAARPPNDLGTVSPDVLATLDATIRTTDFAALRSHPLTGQCPTAIDGQELVFEFASPGGIERIASCETAVDFGTPLFRAVSAALGPLVPLPSR
jgi:hypothetical protein